MERDEGMIPDSMIEYTYVSKAIHVGPCILEVVNLAGDGAAADCQIFDGVNDKGKQKGHIEALSGTTFHFDTNGGVLFHVGIYIEVNATSSKVTVIYKPVSSKDI